MFDFVKNVSTRFCFIPSHTTFSEKQNLAIVYEPKYTRNTSLYHVTDYFSIMWTIHKTKLAAVIESRLNLVFLS